MTDTAFAYLDESGDLGWKLNLPYLQGGSSRYFVIAIAIGMNKSYRRIGKVVDKLHELQKWTSTKEKKWGTVKSHAAREAFCQLAAVELARNSDIQVVLAVYHKETAPDYLRSVDVRAMHPEESEANLIKLEAKYKGRAHLVYAMMVAESLADHLPEMATFTYCPDELNEGHRALDHILTYRLQVQQQRDLAIRRVDRTAPMQRGLDFSDMCAGAAFEAYERNDHRYLNIIKPYVVIKDFSNAKNANQTGSDDVTAPVVDIAATLIKVA